MYLYIVFCLCIFFSFPDPGEGINSGYFGRPNITHIIVQGTGTLPRDDPDGNGSCEDIFAYKRKISRTMNRAKYQRKPEKVDSAHQSYCEIDEIEPGLGVEKCSS